jgi:hypothetical protein
VSRNIIEDLVQCDLDRAERDNLLRDVDVLTKAYDFKTQEIELCTQVQDSMQTTVVEKEEIVRQSEAEILYWQGMYKKVKVQRDITWAGVGTVVIFVGLKLLGIL